MTATLSNGSTTFAGLFVSFPWTSDRQARTITHELIGGGVEYTLTPAMPRTGSLRIVADSEAQAHQIEAAHASPAVWTVTGVLADPLRYVVTGSLSVEQAQGRWIVELGYSEVAA